MFTGSITGLVAGDTITATYFPSMYVGVEAEDDEVDRAEDGESQPTPATSE